MISPVSGYRMDSTLRISAFLCASAVNYFFQLFTAEMQRNAEIRREATSI
jgi:hypothetical protein